MARKPLHLPAGARGPINRGDEQGGPSRSERTDHPLKPANSEASPTGETKSVNATLREQSFDTIREVGGNNNRLARSARK